jgi:hypothetical protein
MGQQKRLLTYEQTDSTEPRDEKGSNGLDSKAAPASWHVLDGVMKTCVKRLMASVGMFSLGILNLL